jgi:isopentenyl phosphate kinase
MLTFLKLGGSLITDKRQAETPRIEVLQRLGQEIAQALDHNASLRLLLGHGSGSFGHVVGKRYGTRSGIHSLEQWYGFAATHDAAARLNRLVTTALLEAGVSAWSIQPSVALRCVDGRVIDGPLSAVQHALQAGLVPLVYGDVALDEVRGGTIVSTEELFNWLALSLQPARMILVGEIDGVYSADPRLDTQAQPLRLLTPQTFESIALGLGASHGVDVTGGMAAKVRQSLSIVTALPKLEVVICSGMIEGNVRAALLEERASIGTVIRADEQ